MGGIVGFSNDAAAELIRDDARWEVTSKPNVYRVEINGYNLLTGKGRIAEFMFP